MPYGRYIYSKSGINNLLILGEIDDEQKRAFYRCFLHFNVYFDRINTECNAEYLAIECKCFFDRCIEFFCCDYGICYHQFFKAPTRL